MAHIKINDTTPRIQYTATASQTIFTIPFEFFEDGDITVYEGTSATPISDSLYTLSGAGDTGGGTLTYLTGKTVGTIVTITRESSIKRTTDFTDGGDWTATNVNDQLDKLTTYIQEIEDLYTRAIKLPVFSSLSDLTFPDGSANNIIGWDSAGTGLENKEIATLITNYDTVFSGLATNDFTQYNGTNWTNLTPQETAEALEGSNFDFTGTNTFAGKVAFKDDGELTIATGAVTITGTVHTVDTESDAATDDLATINGGSDGEIVVISPENAARTVVLVDSGNIQLPGGVPVILDNTDRHVTLKYDSGLTKWVVLGAPLDDVVNTLGDTGGGTVDIDLDDGRSVSATVSTSTTTFTFSNPKPTGYEDLFTLRLTNGGSQTVNWPASVEWSGGTAPVLTSSGTDELVFKTIDGGTNWVGASLLDVS